MTQLTPGPSFRPTAGIKKGQVSPCPFDFSRLPGWYQNAGTTAPSYFSMMKSFTASDFSALASFCMASLSLLCGRATRIFTYGDSAPRSEERRVGKEWHTGG